MWLTIYVLNGRPDTQHNGSFATLSIVLLGVAFLYRYAAYRGAFECAAVKIYFECG